VYNAVLSKRSYKMLTTGTLWKQYHIEVGVWLQNCSVWVLLTKPMCKMKTDWPAYKNISCTGHRTTWDWTRTITAS
jgi:Xaa-Pro aminopeptidase